MKPYKPQTLPLDCIDWESHVSLIGQASAALGNYDGMLQGIVNPKVLLSPLITNEAVLSSRIEGSQATMEGVLEYEADPPRHIEPSKQADFIEAINYREALRQAVEKLRKRPLCLNMIRELHEILLDSVRGKNKDRGEFRRSQTFIGPPGCSIEKASFVPPSVDLLQVSLDNWEKYLHFEEKDRLVQLAVAKAQFELIHPFLDGNGRIGRMLVPLFIFEKKVLSSPMFYISAYFETNQEVYYRRLQAISKQGDWNGWIHFFLRAIVEQAKANTRKTRAILDLYERMKKDVREVTRSQYAINAIDAMFDLMIFQTTDFIDRSGIPRASAQRILKTLREEGIIKILIESSGRRPAFFVFGELFSITEGEA